MYNRHQATLSLELEQLREAIAIAEHGIENLPSASLQAMQQALEVSLPCNAQTRIRAGMFMFVPK